MVAIEFVVWDVGQQHRGSAFEKRCGDTLSDALGGAGDDRDVAAHRVRMGVAHVERLSGAGRPAKNGRSR